jgi:rhodanese-related sulfurtransferase
MNIPAKTHHPGFLALVEDAKTRIRHIGLEEYKDLAARGEAGLLIDVREESEWAAGHAEGAIFLSKGIIERDIEKTVPDRSQRLVLYCGGGYRSALAADALQKMGYTDVISLDGGWKAWAEGGMPVSAPPKPQTDTPAGSGR